MSEAKQTTVLVVGATGKQGGACVSALLSSPSASSLNIRFITRNPDSGSSKKLIAKGLKAFKGDLSDKSSLTEALTGCDKAFFVTDAMAGEQKEGDSGINFVDVAKECGVKFLVFSSVSAADVATNVPHFRSKNRVEKHLKASGIKYTILRPVAFMDNFPAESSFTRFMVIGLLWSSISWKPLALVDCKDIGIFASKALLDSSSPTFENQTMDLSSGAFTLDDLSEAIEKTQGYKPWFGRYMTRYIKTILPHDFKQMLIFFETKGYPAVGVEKLREIHPGLTTLEDYFSRAKK